MLGSAKLHTGGTGVVDGGDGGDTGGQENVNTHWLPSATYAPEAYDPSGQSCAMLGTGKAEQSGPVEPELEPDPEPEAVPELDPEPELEPELPPSPEVP